VADQGSSALPEEPTPPSVCGLGQTGVAAAVTRTVPTIGGLGAGLWQGSIRWFLAAAAYYVVADPLRDFLLDVSHQVGPVVADALSERIKRRGIDS
jgi:hypothetical protein